MFCTMFYSEGMKALSLVNTRMHGYSPGNLTFLVLMVKYRRHSFFQTQSQRVLFSTLELALECFTGNWQGLNIQQELH